jgi:ATP-dependent exoDNAse (exonuclease V) alpha subunit
VAQAWREAGSQSNDKGAARKVLVVCATHEEIANVTDAIRAERKRAGELGESSRVERLVPQSYTTAQKSQPQNFREGQVLAFHRATKDVNRNELLEVVRVERHKVVARNAAGGERELTSKQAKCFEVYERRVIEVAPNEKLMLTANRRESGFRGTNGEMVTVAGVDERGRIQLVDGRRLPANYQHFDYGYAVTAHRSQGKSVDAVVISGDAMKKELFYVAASRGRESVRVITSDKELLRLSVTRSGQRQSASELVRKIGRDQVRRTRLGVQREVKRGPAAARNMARRAAWREQGRFIEAPIPQQEIRRETPARDHGVERGRDYGFSR